MEPVMCGIGYRGSENVDCTSESYIKWHDMINRCYNAKFHKRQPQYMECTVCEEWLNYSNFKVWYDQHKIAGMSLDLDRILYLKGIRYIVLKHVALYLMKSIRCFLMVRKTEGIFL